MSGLDNKWLWITVTVVFAYLWFFSEDKTTVVEAPLPSPAIQKTVTETIPKEESFEQEMAPVKPKQNELTFAPPPSSSSPSPRAKYPGLDDSFIPFDEQGKMYITQITQVGKHLVYQGDVLIGDKNDLPELMKNRVVKRGRPSKWPGGRIPFVLDERLHHPDKVLEAIEYLNLMTHVKFIKKANQKDYVLITPGDQDCYSYAGKIGGEQEIFLTSHCGVKEILHEMMHTLGFMHEQTREDRDQYVEVLWDNIDEINHLQFKKIPNDFLGLTGRPFDFESIMLYDSYVFARSRQEPAMLTSSGDIIPESNALLSQEDIERVNLAYPDVN